MPLLKNRTANPNKDFRDARLQLADSSELGLRPVANGFRSGLLAACANPRCATSWLQLLRSRSAPVFEGGWSCSAACTAERMETAVRRELDGYGGTGEIYRHRVPLGLTMIEKGWITAAQLRSALDAQKASGVRLGQCLILGGGVSERQVTRALSLQWSCPVIPLRSHDPGAMSVVMPRLFVDAFGALPMRIAAGKLVYLGFEERLDPALSLAVERMSGLRVESGLVAESEFRPAHARMLSATFPPVELVEASSEPVLARVLARVVERARPLESRLVRVHDCLWLRMWSRAQAGIPPGIDSVQDVICTVGA